MSTLVIKELVEPGERIGTSDRDSVPVYEEIRNAIISGDLAPGTPLVEAGLAKQFGISRSPIREALVRLSYEGLLERQGRAMTVRVLRAEDVLELYEVRIPLERAAARAAAERRTDLDLGRLAAITEEIDALDLDQIDQRSRLAHAFHFVIWQATHNAILAETLEHIHVRVMGLSSTTLHSAERWRVFLEECHTIFAAIRDRDVELAGDTAERQMVNAREARVKIYSANPGKLPDRYPVGR